ncbi:MAG: ABC transporter permease [Planctomycetota bacterium]|jgi:putative ABC transport system permease protein
MIYIWRNLLQRKVRTLLSILGVAVAIGGVVALVSISDGMVESIDGHMEDTGAALTVFSRDVADLLFSRVTGEDIAVIEAIGGVEEVSRGNATLLQKPDVGKGRKSPGILICFGRVPGERLMQRMGAQVSQGRLPKEPHEVLAGAVAAANIGLKVGDRLPLFRRSYLGVKEYEVVGIYASGTGWEETGIVVDARIISEQLGKTDSYHVVFVYTAPEKVDSVQAEIEKRFPGLVAVPPGKLTSQFESQLDMLEDFTGLVVAIALAIGVLGVLNTMMMSVSERTREIGMLRALGWSRPLIARLIVLEGLMLSLLGGAFGLILGFGGSELLTRTWQGGGLVAAYHPMTFVQGMAIAAFVGTLAALYPAVRAANLRPVEALRYE